METKLHEIRERLEQLEESIYEDGSDTINLIVETKWLVEEVKNNQEELNSYQEEFESTIGNNFDVTHKGIISLSEKLDEYLVKLDGINSNLQFTNNRVNDLWLSNNGRIRRRERWSEVGATIWVILLLIPLGIGIYTILSYLVGK